MSNLVIVAIPKENDYVHKISSEKVAHMTLLFLGDALANPNLIKIVDFVEHAVKVQKRGPFMMDVDHRGELGPDKADVLFFRKNWDYDQIAALRGQLLQYTPIKTAYDSVTQHENWTPHLTLGYPETPAKKDTRDYPGTNWVDFDRIAVWYGDYEGPEFRLEYSYDLAEVAMGDTADLGAEFLEHFGVKGMKWGVRKEDASIRINKKGTAAGTSVGTAIALATTGPAAYLIPRVREESKQVKAFNKNATAVKKAAKSDAKFSKRANDSKNFVAVHNGAVAELNKNIEPLNKKYPMNLTTHANRAKRDAYDREVEDMMRTAYSNSANKIKSKTGNLSLDLEFKNDGSFVIKSKQIKHAADDSTFIGHLKRDKMGKVIDFVFDDFVKHDTIALGEEFLEHYGVKGMRWGLRRSESSRVGIGAKMATKESARRTKRSASPVRAQDTIGRNRLTKTKIHTVGGEDHPAAGDAVRVAKTRQKLKTSGVHALTNDEIQDVIRRTNLEKQLKDAQSHKWKTPTQELIDALLEPEPSSQNRR